MVYVNLNSDSSEVFAKKEPIGNWTRCQDICVQFKRLFGGGNFKTFRLWHGGYLLLIARIIEQIRKE